MTVNSAYDLYSMLFLTAFKDHRPPKQPATAVRPSMIITKHDLYTHSSFLSLSFALSVLTFYDMDY